MTSTHGVRVSVIIPTFQRRALVIETVRSVLANGPGPAEIIVVVDGSTDGTAQALAALDAPSLRIVEQENCGAAAARNAGARTATGQILLFLDDDMEAEPTLIAEHLKSHAEGADCVLGHMPLHPDFDSGPLAHGMRDWAADRLARLSRPDASLKLHDLLTGQMSVSAKVFAAVDGFDARFTKGGAFGNEDVDIGLRLLMGGYDIRFNPRAVSAQRYSVSLADHLRQWRQAGAADVVFARKHPQHARPLFVSARADFPVTSAIARTLLAAPGGARLADILRPSVLALAERGGVIGRSIFFRHRALEYWTGVRGTGGVPGARRLRVLAYHAMSDLGDTVLASYGVPTDEFRRQLSQLTREGHALISPAEFKAFIRGEAGLPRNAVLITFDDAYADLPQAIEVLHDFGVSAVVFVVSSQLGGANDWDASLGAPRLPLLEAAALKDLQAKGVEIGGHSVGHRYMPNLSPSEAAAEIEGCLAALQDAGLGRPELFAYPYGGSNPAVRAAAAAAGVLAAFSVTPGVVRLSSDRMRLPRVEILRGDIGPKLRWKVRYAALCGWGAYAASLIPPRLVRAWAGLRRRLAAVSHRGRAH